MAIVKSDSHLYRPLKCVDILTDYGFKLPFGDKELLVEFLDALSEVSGKVVTSARYLSREIVAVDRHGRTIYYDIPVEEIAEITGLSVEEVCLD